MRLPTNSYDEDTTERDALLAIFEQVRAIRSTVTIVSVVAVPLMLLMIIKLLS